MQFTSILLAIGYLATMTVSSPISPLDTRLMARQDLYACTYNCIMAGCDCYCAQDGTVPGGDGSACGGGHSGGGGGGYGSRTPPNPSDPGNPGPPAGLGGGGGSTGGDGGDDGGD